MCFLANTIQQSECGDNEPVEEDRFVESCEIRDLCLPWVTTYKMGPRAESFLIGGTKHQYFFNQRKMLPLYQRPDHIFDWVNPGNSHVLMHMRFRILTDSGRESLPTSKWSRRGDVTLPRRPRSPQGNKLFRTSCLCLSRWLSFLSQGSQLKGTQWHWTTSASFLIS